MKKTLLTLIVLAHSACYHPPDADDDTAFEPGVEHVDDDMVEAGAASEFYDIPECTRTTVGYCFTPNRFIVKCYYDGVRRCVSPGMKCGDRFVC